MVEAAEAPLSFLNRASQPVRLTLARNGLAQLQVLLSSGPRDVDLRFVDCELCVQAVLALEDDSPLEVFADGDAIVDWVGATLSSRLGCVRLSRTELRLFGALFERRGEVIDRRHLVEWTWPDTCRSEGANVLGVYVHLLRQRLSTIGVPSALETVRGIGYRLAR
jgi:DNA-binding response OmpR family regulator